MDEFYCKYCNLDLTFIDKNRRNGHVGNCKLNPKRTIYNLKISKNVKDSNLKKLKIEKEKYEKNPKKCLECDCLILFKNKHKKFCCQSHAAIYTNKNRIRTKESILIQGEKLRKNKNFNESIIKISLNKKGKRKQRFCEFCEKEIDLSDKKNSIRYHSECRWNKRGHEPRKGSSRGKCGWYEGYWCDSSWELAYVIYNLEHNIRFKRNKKGFNYFYKNKWRKYYPDFVIADKLYVEIKSYIEETTLAKKQHFKGNLIIITKGKIEKYLNYCINKYGKNFINLYDKK